MKASPVHGVIGYEETTVFRVTYWITSIIASLIPIASIAVLYVVHSMSTRLAIIACFNVLISICLCGLTNAKRAEVFAVASA
jgi:membrane protein YdbS with pleckstrin-like domain